MGREVFESMRLDKADEEAKNKSWQTVSSPSVLKE